MNRHPRGVRGLRRTVVRGQGRVELVLDVAVDPLLEALLHRSGGVVLLQRWEFLAGLLQRKLVDVLD